jgi:hypothetical protein
MNNRIQKERNPRQIKQTKQHSDATTMTFRRFQGSGYLEEIQKVSGIGMLGGNPDGFRDRDVSMTSSRFQGSG